MAEPVAEPAAALEERGEPAGALMACRPAAAGRALPRAKRRALVAMAPRAELL